MNTIRMTAIITENARSRTQASALQRLEWAGAASWGGSGLWGSCIPAFILRQPLSDVRGSDVPASGRQKMRQDGQRHSTFLERPVVESGEAVRSALLLVLVSNVQPVGPADKIHGQLARGELGALQLFDGLFLLLEGLLLHQVEGLLVGHVEHVEADV